MNRPRQRVENKVNTIVDELRNLSRLGLVYTVTSEEATKIETLLLKRVRDSVADLKAGRTNSIFKLS